MDGVAGDAVLGPAPPGLNGHEDVCGLGLAKGDQRIVGPAFEVDVVEVHRRPQVAAGTGRDDARNFRRRVATVRGGGEGPVEASRENEVAEVGELQLVPGEVHGPFRHRHDPGVVDQQVQGPAQP